MSNTASINAMRPQQADAEYTGTYRRLCGMYSRFLDRGMMPMEGVTAGNVTKLKLRAKLTKPRALSEIRAMKKKALELWRTTDLTQSQIAIRLGCRPVSVSGWVCDARLSVLPTGRNL